MKPLMRSDEGPEAWISYDSLEAGFRSKQAMRDFLDRDSTLSHLPFVFEQDKKSAVVSRTRKISREPVPKEMSLIVLESPVAFQKNKTSGVKTKKHRQQKGSATMAEKKEWPSWVKYMIAAVILVVICIGLLLTCCWGWWSYNKVQELKTMKTDLVTAKKELEDCKKSMPAAKLVPSQAPAAYAPPAPRKEEKEVQAVNKNFNELVFYNQSGKPAKVKYWDNVRKIMVTKTFDENFGLQVYSTSTNVFVNEKPKHFSFKKSSGGRINHNIRA